MQNAMPISMAPVLAITRFGGKDLVVTAFQPVGEFFKPFVTGPNRIPISIEEHRDEDGQQAVAEPKSEEGVSAAAAIGEPRSGGSPSTSRGNRCGRAQHYIDKGAEYYEQRNRQQQIEFVRKKAALLGLQVTPAHV
jgi:hypothetical protein